MQTGPRSPFPFQPDRGRADAILRAGVAALQRRDGGEARRLLQDATLVPPPWLLLAQACRLEGDDDAEEQALDALLAREPRHVAGLLMKGDVRARRGDDRGAGSFYQLAIAQARTAGQVPSHLLPELRRAEAFMQASALRYEDHLRGELAAGGADPAAVGGRFAEAIDILTGRAQVQLQQPTAFYYPGLAQRQFFERGEFAWAAAIEGETDAIAAELEAALGAGGEGFAPYIQAQPGRPRSTNPLFDDPKWSALYLWHSGAPVEEHAARFPSAMRGLTHVPLPVIPGRAPMALFSSLRPGTHIVPHTGHINTRLICHLPLIVPPGCRFRVGNFTRAWERGRLLIFDDTMEHEAWNDGTAIRVVLLFEVWRPELSDEERQALTTLYRSINLYGTDI